MPAGYTSSGRQTRWQNHSERLRQEEYRASIWARDDFQSLQAEWYGKLAEQGFEDIELESQAFPVRHYLESRRAKIRGEETGLREYWELVYEWVDLATYHSRSERFALAARAEGWLYPDIHERFAPCAQGVQVDALKTRIERRIAPMLAHFGVADAS